MLLLQVHEELDFAGMQVRCVMQVRCSTSRVAEDADVLGRVAELVHIF